MADERPLQDRLKHIFDDAGGSDELTELLRMFDFESNHELADAIVIGMSRATPPAEPTDAMIEAGMNVVREIAVSPDAGDGHYLADVYRAMTAAREP